MQPAMLMSWQGSHDIVHAPAAPSSAGAGVNKRLKAETIGPHTVELALGQGPELLACWHWHVLTWCAHMVDGPQKCIMGVGCHVIGGDDWFASACEVHGWDRVGCELG